MHCKGVGEWRTNGWDQSPYQYLLKNKVISLRQPHLDPRRHIVVEEERAHQLPSGYTAPLSQLDLPHLEMQKRRQSRLGNAWHVGAGARAVFVGSFMLLTLFIHSRCRSSDASCVRSIGPQLNSLSFKHINVGVGMPAQSAFIMPCELVGYRLTRS